MVVVSIPINVPRLKSDAEVSVKVEAPFVERITEPIVTDDVTKSVGEIVPREKSASVVKVVDLEAESP
jgi:hypothetical protein